MSPGAFDFSAFGIPPYLILEIYTYLQHLRDLGTLWLGGFFGGRIQLLLVTLVRPQSGKSPDDIPQKHAFWEVSPNQGRALVRPNQEMLCKRREVQTDVAVPKDVGRASRAGGANLPPLVF